MRQKHIEFSEWKKRAKFTQDELRQYLLEMKLELLQQGKKSFELNLDSIRIRSTIDSETAEFYYSLQIVEHFKARHLRREFEPVRYTSINQIFDHLFETYKYKCTDYSEDN